MCGFAAAHERGLRRVLIGDHDGGLALPGPPAASAAGAPEFPDDYAEGSGQIAATAAPQEPVLFAAWVQLYLAPGLEAI